MKKQKTKQASVGQVKTQVVKIDLPPEGLVLENKQMLPELHVAYEKYGELSPAGDNVVYICHALTGDAHVAGYHDTDDPKPGWWDVMVGPGKGIDTNNFHVICANILGGCTGTTGPSSINPRTGKPYGSLFPSITAGDMVYVQYLLLKQMGIKHLVAVIGGSFGGMQVLEWSIRYPQMVDKCVCIASSMSLSAQALAFDIMGRNAILADSDWAGGDYYENQRKPTRGLAQARMIGHVTYLSSAKMKDKFGREKKVLEKPLPRFSTSFQVESYLGYQGTKFVSRFDANSYLHITEAMDVFDLTENCDDPSAAFKPVNPQTRFLVVALSSDWLFPAAQSMELTRALVKAGKYVSYCLLRSSYGHDAFLVEVEYLSDVVNTFLASPNPACAAEGSASGQAAQLGRAQSTAVEAVEPTARPRLASSAASECRLIENMVKPGTKVLDLGCGDGELLSTLAAHKGIVGLGIDIDLESVLQILSKGQEIIQCDLDEGLNAIPDDSYDYAILSQTLQVVRKPRFVMKEMLRVAREGLIIFPNFGNWRNRVSIGLSGQMPVSDSFPFQWYNTPNIHLATLKDFKALCAKDGVRITETIYISRGWLDATLIRLGWSNLGSDRVLMRISRGG